MSKETGADGAAAQRFLKCLHEFLKSEGRRSFDDERRWIESAFIPFLSKEPHNERLLRALPSLLSACSLMIHSVGNYGRWKRPPTTRDLYLKTVLFALSRPEFEPLLQVDRTVSADVASMFCHADIAQQARRLLVRTIVIVLDDHAVRLAQLHNLKSASMASECSPSRRRTDHLPVDIAALACVTAHFRLPTLSHRTVTTFGCNVRDLPLHIQERATDALSCNVTDRGGSGRQADDSVQHGRSRSFGLSNTSADHDAEANAARVGSQYRFEDRAYLLRQVCINAAHLHNENNKGDDEFDAISNNGFLWGCFRQDNLMHLLFMEYLMQHIDLFVESGESSHMIAVKKYLCKGESMEKQDKVHRAREDSENESRPAFANGSSTSVQDAVKGQVQSKNKFLSALSGAKQAIFAAVEKRRRDSREIANLPLGPIAGEFDRIPGGVSFMYGYFRRILRLPTGQLPRIKESSLRMIKSLIRGGDVIPPEALREHRIKELHLQYGNRILDFLIRLLLRRTNANDADSVNKSLQLIELWFAELRTGISRMIDCSELFAALRILLKSHRLRILQATLQFVYRVLQSFEGADRREIVLNIIVGEAFFHLFLHWDPDVRRMFHYILVYRCPSPLKCLTNVGEEPQEAGIFCLAKAPDMPLYRCLIHLDPDLDTVVRSRIKGYIEVVCSQTRGGVASPVAFDEALQRFAPASITSYYNVLSGFEEWKAQHLKSLKESLAEAGRMPPPYRVVYPDISNVAMIVHGRSQLSA